MKKLPIAVALFAAVFLCLGTLQTAVAQTGNQGGPNSSLAPFRSVSVQELYYYDRSGLRIPLPIQRKMLVRFVDLGSSKTEVEKTTHLKGYGAKEQNQISALYARAEFSLDFLSTTDTATMVSHIKRAAEDSILDVAPVFQNEGMEVVVDGVYLETITPLSRDTVRLGIARAYGNEAMIHELTPVIDHRGVSLWHISFKRLFFLGDKKLPLHVLSMANILDRGDRKPIWVKRAYPKFAYLQDPVVATINVSPRSGTVGEGRMLDLSIHISGNVGDVEIDESVIPSFPDRKFSLISGGKPPLAGFFDHGNPPPQREQRKQLGPHSWKITHRYYFDLYAPELEWTIGGVEIPYVYKGKKMSAKIPPVTFFVRPHLDEKHTLNDIPEAYVFPHAVRTNQGLINTVISARWYAPIAQFVGGVEKLKWGALATTVLTFASLMYFGFVVVRHVYREHTLHPKQVVVFTDDELTQALAIASATTDPIDALSEMHDVLSTILHQRFPEISPRNSTYQQWKAVMRSEKYATMLESFDGSEIEEVFDHLEKRHDKNYASNELAVLNAHREDVAMQIRLLGEKLRTLKEV